MDPAEEARMLFEATDTDKSGTITKDEFAKLCKIVTTHALERNERHHQLSEEVCARSAFPLGAPIQ